MPSRALFLSFLSPNLPWQHPANRSWPKRGVPQHLSDFRVSEVFAAARVAVRSMAGVRRARRAHGRATCGRDALRATRRRKLPSPAGSRPGAHPTLTGLPACMFSLISVRHPWVPTGFWVPNVPPWVLGAWSLGELGAAWCSSSELGGIPGVQEAGLARTTLSSVMFCFANSMRVAHSLATGLWNSKEVFSVV